MIPRSHAAECPPHIAEAFVYDYDYFRDPGLFVDPHRRILDLVKHAPPLFWTPHNGGHWMVIGYQEALRILRDPETFSSSHMPSVTAQVRPLLPDGRRVPMMTPLGMDPPRHGIYRAPLQKTFSPKTVMGLKTDIEQLAISLLDEIALQGHADFVSAVTEPLPVRIFLKMMGLPDDRIGEFRALARDVFGPLSSDPFVDMMRIRRVADAMLEHIEARRTDPQDDIISMLWSVEIDGQPMTLELMEDYCCLLFVAGLDTVINAMAYGIRHLAMNPELQARLRARPELIVEATEELLRRYSFAGPPRWVARDAEFDGCRMAAGEQVIIYYAAINLDPREFPSPEAVDIDRENKNHLIFGGGPHRCLGSHLARVELQVLYQAVLDKLPEFRLDADQTPVFHAGNMLAVSSLPIRWD